MLHVSRPATNVLLTIKGKHYWLNLSPGLVIINAFSYRCMYRFEIFTRTERGFRVSPLFTSIFTLYGVLHPIQEFWYVETLPAVGEVPQIVIYMCTCMYDVQGWALNVPMSNVTRNLFLRYRAFLTTCFKRLRFDTASASKTK